MDVIEGDSPSSDIPPPSFHYEYADDWGAWVLDHGLPTLPEALGDDDEVPIAYWVRIPLIPYTQSGVFVHSASEAA